MGDGNPQPDLVITENQINIIASGPSEKLGAWTSNSFRKTIQKILFQINDNFSTDFSFHIFEFFFAYFVSLLATMSKMTKLKLNVAETVLQAPHSR